MWWMLCLLPLVEAPIEAWFEIHKKISVNHFWSAALRALMMVAVGFALYKIGETQYWWQGMLLCFGIFMAFFNYLYNLLTGRPLLYLRAKGTDKILALAPPWGRWIWELILLGASIQIYITPNILFK